jgi:hypothetical protein
LSVQLDSPFVQMFSVMLRRGRMRVAPHYARSGTRE